MADIPLSAQIMYRYGLTAMVDKAIEECLELATELQKSKSRDNEDALVIELADVLIVIDQQIELREISEQVEERKQHILTKLPKKLQLA